jgi:radical SAM superfamily enzyme YgiQ (UPF0313 family)
MARVLFLQKVWSENLGPMLLSSVIARHGHTAELRIGAKPPDRSTLRRLAPDLVAFSITTGTHLWAFDIAARVKELLPHVPVIFGGAHPTYFPEAIHHPAVDVICRGEGEQALLELLDRIDSGASFDDIPNLWVRHGESVVENPLRPLEQDLDSLPFPDRNLYYRYKFLRNSPTKNFITGRGCPYNCAYCAIPTLKAIYKDGGTFTRFRSPEAVIEEIRAVKRDFGLRTVCFQDDTFILKKSRLFPLLELYRREIGLPFICHVRADLLDDEIARALKEAGCHSVDFGLESGDPEIRRTVLRKTVTDDQIYHAARVLKKWGIPFRTTNMLGLPGERLEQAYRTIRINQRIGTNYPSCSVYQPYPRTELGDRAIAMGLAGEDYSVDRIGASFYRSSVLPPEHTREVANLQKFFFLAVKFPSLAPLIRRLARLPGNPLYDFVFLGGYAFNYMGSENLGPLRVLNLGLHTIKDFFFGRD